MAKLNAANRVATLLAESGWQPFGETKSEQVRIGTSKVPVYGGIGGEVRTFGGRQRYRKGETDLFVTLGRNSVCFYHRQDGKAIGFRTYATGREIDYITEAVTKAATSDMPVTATEKALEAAKLLQSARYEQERQAVQEARVARLEGGERILLMSGTKGRLYERKTGLLVVLDGDPAEVPVCCRLRGRWLIKPTYRNHFVGAADEHSEDCPSRLASATE